MDDERVPVEMQAIHCPDCGHFVGRAKFEGFAEVNCRSRRCTAAVLIVISNGRMTVSSKDRPVIVKGA